MDPPVSRTSSVTELLRGVDPSDRYIYGYPGPPPAPSVSAMDTTEDPARRRTAPASPPAELGQCRPSDRALWVCGVALTAAVSALLAAGGCLMALFMLMFFDDPSAPGAYAALIGMLVLAACCVAGLAVPVVFSRWGRGSGSTAEMGRRLLVCAAGYLVPLSAAVVQFGVLMH